MSERKIVNGNRKFLELLSGEYEAFQHILRNASGLVKQIIEESSKLSVLGEKERKELATLIYYPKKRMRLGEKKTNNWYKTQLRRLLIVLKRITFKYTRSKVRKNLPKNFVYIISEMLVDKKQPSPAWSPNTSKKGWSTFQLYAMVDSYFESIVENIVKEGCAEDVIVAIAKAIQRLSVEDLHIIGDIYDRGDGAEKIMDYLINQNTKVDVQFGNHDVLWMSAASGCATSVMNIIRISVRYRNTSTLEHGYGIHLLPLKNFADKIYGDKSYSKFFEVKDNAGNINYSARDFSKMQKAIFIIQMKLESQIIREHPEYEMEDRLLLKKINFKKGTVEIEGKDYPLNDTNFPTIDPKNPEKLSKEEQELVDYFLSEINKSKKLHKHVDFLLRKGSLYMVKNENILFHACIPINEDFTFRKVKIGKDEYAGKELLEKLDFVLREQYFKRKSIKDRSIGFWLWCGKNSPLFGKSKMATFERYFIEDKATWVEKKCFYYSSRDNPKLIDLLFKEFDVDKEKGHVIVGHVPVIAKIGESPVMNNGKYITIDGGFSKAYQKVTGIAGYTMRTDSTGMYLCTHTSFKSKKDAVVNFTDLESEVKQLEVYNTRVKDTDIGKVLNDQVNDIRKLINAYEEREIKQKYIKETIIQY